MDLHVIIGWVVFVAALTIFVGIIVVTAAAFRSLSTKGGPENARHIFRSVSGGSSPERGGKASASCYWDCMNGFHWNEGWEEICAPACGLHDKHAEAFFPGSVYRL